MLKSNKLKEEKYIYFKHSSLLDCSNSNDFARVFFLFQAIDEEFSKVKLGNRATRRFIVKCLERSSWLI